MSIENIYATPIYAKTLENYGGINNQIDEVINNIKFNEKDEWGRPNKVTTPFFDQDNIEDYSLTMLSKAIDDCIIDYTKHLSISHEGYYRKSWILKLHQVQPLQKQLKDAWQIQFFLPDHHHQEKQYMQLIHLQQLLPFHQP